MPEKPQAWQILACDCSGPKESPTAGLIIMIIIVSNLLCVLTAGQAGSRFTSNILNLYYRYMRYYSYYCFADKLMLKSALKKIIHRGSSVPSVSLEVIGQYIYLKGMAISLPFLSLLFPSLPWLLASC